MKLIRELRSQIEKLKAMISPVSIKAWSTRNGTYRDDVNSGRGSYCILIVGWWQDYITRSVHLGNNVGMINCACGTIA